MACAKVSARYRVRTGAWRDALSVFARFPVIGAGVNTFPVAMLFYQGHDLDNYWSEAHNDYLQILADGGVVVGTGRALTSDELADVITP